MTIKSSIARRLAIFIPLMLLFGHIAKAQFTIQHQPPTAIEVGEDLNLTFRTPGINSSDIRDANLFYRFGGRASYQQTPAFIEDSQITASISVDNETATIIKYYLVVILQDGSTRTYPENNPRNAPEEVQLVRKSQKADKEKKGTSQISYNILSPEPSENLSVDDVLISLALFYEQEPVSSDSLQLIYDGKDVTDQAEVNTFFISFIPETAPPGKHSVSVKLKNGDELKTITEWSFRTRSSAVVSAQNVSRTQPNRHEGQLELLARNQEIGNNTNDALRGNLRLNGRLGNLQYSFRGLLTSQNESRLQPQNRIFGEIKMGDWLQIEGGDVYPTMSPFTISGRRMRGVNSQFHLANESIHLQLLYGQLNRSVDNLYNSIEKNITSIQLDNNQTVQDTSFQLTFQPGGTGTFKRKIAGMRLAFGTGENFKWGIHGISIKDQEESITVVDDFQDAQTHLPDLVNNLSSQDLSRLQQNPDLLDVRGSNPNPKGNFVAGSDVELNLFNNRLQWNAEVAASLLTEDISGGPLDAERAADLGINLDQGIEDALDRLSFLIVINEQMSSLPFKFKSDEEGGNRKFTAFIPRSIFAGESEASLRLYNNDLRLTYRWIGPNFETLANSTVRQDLAGYNLTDRIRLFDNRFYVTLGAELLNDNVVNNREATTKSNSYRTNLSWFPRNPDLPRISGGFRFNTRDNDINVTNPFLDENEVTAGVRNVRRITDDSLAVLTDAKDTQTQQFNISVNQRFSLFDASHTAGVNVMMLNTNDDAFAFGDTESLSLSFTLDNRFQNLPLNTNFGFNLNKSEAVSGLTDIDIWGLNAGFELFLLQDKLTLSTDFNFTSNERVSTPLTIDENSNSGLDASQQFLDDIFVPQRATDEQGNVIFDNNGNPVLATSKSESNLYYTQVRGKYRLNSHHQFIVSLNFNNVVSQVGTGIANDRVLQARYIYRF